MLPLGILQNGSQMTEKAVGKEEMLSVNPMGSVRVHDQKIKQMCVREKSREIEYFSFNTGSSLSLNLSSNPSRRETLVSPLPLPSCLPNHHTGSCFLVATSYLGQE